MNEFDALLIPRSTAESLSQREINDLTIGFAWRNNLWKKPGKLITAGLIQMVGAAMIFAVTMLPADRILNPANLSQSPAAKIERLLLVNGAVSLAILGSINWWIIERGKRSQKLIKVIEQIEEYNRIVHSIVMINQVTKLTVGYSPSHQVLIVDILAKTRHNLLIALELEQNLHRFPHASDLTVSIAHKLLDLQYLGEQAQLAEYNSLLTQAWEIGMSVYQEIPTPSTLGD